MLPCFVLVFNLKIYLLRVHGYIDSKLDLADINNCIGYAVLTPRYSFKDT